MGYGFDTSSRLYKLHFSFGLLIVVHCSNKYDVFFMRNLIVALMVY
jgi:hypothetical protein